MDTSATLQRSRFESGAGQVRPSGSGRLLQFEFYELQVSATLSFQRFPPFSALFVLPFLFAAIH